MSSRAPTTEPVLPPADPADEAPEGRGEPRRREAPLVPAGSIAGRALVAVIAIMTFLASLAAGTVERVASASRDWGAEVSREATIQLRPRPGRDADADLARLAALARAAPGVTEAREVPRAESERLLEPWIGAAGAGAVGGVFGDVPVPRLVVLKTARDPAPDLAALRASVEAAVPGALLDDHRAWVARLSAMAGAMVAVGAGILALVLAATALAVAFATRGTMAGNRAVVEVLYLVGATDRFIAAEFGAQFLRLGLRGGAAGAAAAVGFFALAQWLSERWVATAGGEQVEALFGSFALGLGGYAAILGIALVVAVTTAGVSRLTVRRYLATVG